MPAMFISRTIPLPRVQSLSSHHKEVFGTLQRLTQCYLVDGLETPTCSTPEISHRSSSPAFPPQATSKSHSPSTHSPPAISPTTLTNPVISPNSSAKSLHTAVPNSVASSHLLFTLSTTMRCSTPTQHERPLSPLWK